MTTAISLAFPIPITHQLSATKPGFAIFDRKINEIFLIEFSCPVEYNMAANDAQKRVKYEALVFDMQKQYSRQKVKLVVLLVGALEGNVWSQFPTARRVLISF